MHLGREREQTLYNQRSAHTAAQIEFQNPLSCSTKTTHADINRAANWRESAFGPERIVHLQKIRTSTQRKSPRPKKNNNNCQMANYYIALHCLDLCFHYFYLLRIDGIKVSCNCIARKLRARRPAHFNLRISIRGRFGARRARARRRPGRQRGDLRPGGARPRVPSSARAFALSWARLLEAELSAFNMECDEIYGFSLLSFPSRGPAAPLSSIHYSVLRSRRGNCGDWFYFWH